MKVQLTIFLRSAAQESAQNLREHKVIPWEAVVTYKDDTQQLSEAQTEEMSRGLGIQQRAGGRGRGRLMALRKSAISAQPVNLQPASWASNIGTINDPLCVRAQKH